MSIYCYILSFLVLTVPFCANGQHSHSHHSEQDSNIMLQEVHVLNKQGVSGSYRHEQRASKQTHTDKILDHTPGVQMVRRGNYAWEPTIRSLNASQINVTIDGMHIFGACTDRMDPISSYVEPTNLKQLVVNVGPNGDNYGGAIGGGIDFKLNTAMPTAKESFKAMVGTGYETNGNGVQTLATLQYSKSRFALQANGIFRKSQSYYAADRTEIPFSQYQKWNAALSATYQITPSQTLSADYLIDRGKDIGYPALTMDVAYANAHILSLTHHTHRHHALLSHIKTKVYYNNIDHAMDDTKRPAEQVSIHMDMPGKSWTAGFYNELSMHQDNHHLQARTSGYINRLTADMTMYPTTGTPMYMYTIPNAQRTFVAIDLSHKWNLHEKWRIESVSTWSFLHSDLYNQAGKDQLSGEIDGNVDRSNLLGNIRTGTTWSPSSRWQVKANVGYATRAASLQEYYGYYIYNRLDGFDYMGNRKLKSEKAWQLDAGASYDYQKLRIETNLFNYQFTDYIIGRTLPSYTEMTIGANGVKQYINIPSAHLYGAEMSLRIQASKKLSLHSINSYTSGKDDESYALPLIAPLRSMNSIHAQLWGINGQFEVEYNAAQNRVSTVRYGETNTPSCMLFHIGTRRDFQLENGAVFTASLRVENIFDRYYYRHLDIMKVARPGRNFITQITFTL